ncbi:MAG: T9SS type A sorting domain-containing protein [Bacteroidia bacterium]
MKKLITTVVAVSLGLATFAQEVAPLHLATPKLYKAHSITPVKAQRRNHQPPSTQGATTVYINYESADSILYTAGTYMAFAWNINAHYKWPADSSATNTPLNYFLTAFDSIYDSNNQVGYAQKVVSGLVVDSIYISLGQSNASGMADTLVVSLIPVNAGGYPTGAPIAVNPMIIPPSSPLTGNWLQQRMVAFGFNQAITGAAKFAVQVQYFGSKMDTLGFVAGFGSITCSSSPYAVTTLYNPIKTPAITVNSFVQFAQFATYGQLPNAAGQNIGYTCGTTQEPTYIQDIRMVAMVTFNNTTGINDGRTIEGLTLGQCYPNPSTSTATIGYQLADAAKNVDLKVFDVTGRLVMDMNQGAEVVGKHSIQVNVANLAAGTYYYSLKADDHRLTNKMVVVK